MKRAIGVFCASVIVLCFAGTSLGQTPDQIVLVTPADNAVDLSVTTELKWNADTAASEYRVHLSTDPGFDPLDYNEVVSDTVWTVSPDLENGTEYHWKVLGKNGGDEGVFSADRSFITVAGGSKQVVLSTPAHESTGLALDPTLVWGSTGASTYHLQISTSAKFGVLVVDQSSLGVTQYTPSLVEDTKYYWRVKASNAGAFN